LTIITVLSSLFWGPAFAGDAGGPDQPAFDACNQFAEEAVRTPSASPPTMTAGQHGSVVGRPAAPSTQSPSDGATALDSSLRGMAAEGQGDPAYQGTYRDCMRGKLWSGT